MKINQETAYRYMTEYNAKQYNDELNNAFNRFNIDMRVKNSINQCCVIALHIDYETKVNNKIVKQESYYQNYVRDMLHVAGNFDTKYVDTWKECDIEALRIVLHYFSPYCEQGVDTDRNNVIQFVMPRYHIPSKYQHTLFQNFQLHVTYL